MIMFALENRQHLRFHVVFLGWIHYSSSRFFVKIFLKHEAGRIYCLILSQEGNSKLHGCCGYSKSHSVWVSPGLQVVSQHSWTVQGRHSHFKPQTDKTQLSWSGISPDPASSRILLREFQNPAREVTSTGLTLWSYNLHVKYQIPILDWRRWQLELQGGKHILMEKE